jgi:hypothetical protein
VAMAAAIVAMAAACAAAAADGQLSACLHALAADGSAVYRRQQQLVDMVLFMPSLLLIAVCQNALITCSMRCRHGSLCNSCCTCPATHIGSPACRDSSGSTAAEHQQVGLCN